MNNREIFCGTCDATTPYEASPCGDHHNGDCPELVCCRCGAAILLAPLVVWAWLRPRSGTVAPQQRRAA